MFLCFFEIKGFFWRGVRVLLEQTKMNKQRGEVKPISMFTLWASAWFFNQQIEFFFLISCLAVAKSALYQKDLDIFLNTFYENLNIFVIIYIYIIYIYIYLCKKHCHVLCWVYKNRIIPFSLFTTWFFIHNSLNIQELFLRWSEVTR